uniref:RT09845p n=1 Tax=Drosophila melanogaster TaxID=7227 RepID=E0R949_DROME|nr:RT09845p [Drosophila melanogaster]
MMAEDRDSLWLPRRFGNNLPFLCSEIIKRRLRIVVVAGKVVELLPITLYGSWIAASISPCSYMGIVSLALLHWKPRGLCSNQTHDRLTKASKLMLKNSTNRLRCWASDPRQGIISAGNGSACVLAKARRMAEDSTTWSSRCPVPCSDCAARKR